MCEEVEMKLIIIYGVPASGKFSIAKEISRKTGYKLFDNHTLIDLLSSLTLDKISPFDVKSSQGFWKLYRDLRIKVLDSACKIGDVKGMIITEAYTGKKRFFTSIIKTAEKNRCQIYLINLVCEKEELIKRVRGKSRLNFNKLHGKKELEKWVEKYKKINLVYPYNKTLILNNTNLSIKDSANKVLNFINYKK